MASPVKRLFPRDAKLTSAQRLEGNNINCRRQLVAIDSFICAAFLEIFCLSCVAKAAKREKPWRLASPFIAVEILTLRVNCHIRSRSFQGAALKRGAKVAQITGHTR